MLNKEEQKELITLVRERRVNEWNIIGHKADETPYIEFLNELQNKLEDMECPKCLSCNDTGEVWITQEDDKGRDIDTPIKCNCND